MENLPLQFSACWRKECKKHKKRGRADSFINTAKAPFRLSCGLAWPRQQNGESEAWALGGR